MVSSVFAIQENTPICPNTSKRVDELITEIETLNKKHNILSTLSAINVTINYTSGLKMTGKNLYYLLILNYNKKTVQVKSFHASKIEVATKIYDKIEKESTNNVVLVSATSFEALKLAYPNYFVDISAFIDNLKNIIECYKH